MNAELESIAKTIELARTKLSNIKQHHAVNSENADVLDDAEQSLGWALRKLEKLKDQSQRDKPS